MSTKRNTQWLGPLTWVAVPLLFVAAIPAWFVISELANAASLRTSLNSLRESGHLLNISQIQADYQENTHDAGTDDLHLATTLLAGFSPDVPLPYFNRQELSLHIDPSQPWPYRDAAAKTLDRIAPALELLHATTSHPTPVWQPVNFQSFSFLNYYFASSATLNALHLETEYALHDHDTDRALRTILDCIYLAQANEIPTQSSVDGIATFYRVQTYAMIRRTLYANLWQPEQLNKLRQIVATPSDISALPKHMNLRLSQINALLENLDNRKLANPATRLLLGLPSAQKHLVDLNRDRANIGTSDYKVMATTLLRQESQWQASHNRPIPNVETIAINLLNDFTWNHHWQAIRVEEARRFTLTAIAIKQFQLKHQRWPDSLGQLETADPATFGGAMLQTQGLGYAADGDTAHLWRADTTHPTSPTNEKPNITSGELFRNGIDIRLASIR